jgi:hypothetical protein
MVLVFFLDLQDTQQLRLYLSPINYIIRPMPLHHPLCPKLRLPKSSMPLHPHGQSILELFFIPVGQKYSSIEHAVDLQIVVCIFCISLIPTAYSIEKKWFLQASCVLKRNEQNFDGWYSQINVKIVNVTYDVWTRKLVLTGWVSHIPTYPSIENFISIQISFSRGKIPL